MNKTITLVSTLALTLAIGFSPLSLVQAQNKDRTEVSVQDLPKISTTSAMGNFSVSFSGQEVSAVYLVSHLPEWLGTDNNHTFEFVKSSTDELGIKHSVYQHYYKNVKVADDLILIHEKEGKITFVNGELAKNIDLEIKQPLSQTEVESIVNADMKAPNVTFAEFAQVIAKVRNEKGVEVHLVSMINALSLKALRSYNYYVDNTTRQIVKKVERIHRHNDIANHVSPSVSAQPLHAKFISPLVDTSSTSTTFYKGNQPITVDSYNGAFRLKDNARNIHTQEGTGWDGNGTVAGGLTGTIAEYTSTTANFTAANTKPAVEVHWAMKTAYDYYSNVHNRNSYDNTGSIIRNYYNINFNRNATTGAGQAPIDGTNAAAIDVQGIVAMIYGNGMYQGQTGFFNPIVGIDIAGHEYSHLMIGRTADLVYEGESGALNESFADMFGTAIEFYSNVNPNWTIAEGIPTAALGFSYFRSLSNPNSGPAALGSQQPDTYMGTFWANALPPYTQANDHGGVHTNSGVGNFWFFLLSMGGSGTNDIGNAFTVTGITLQKAEKIAYRTVTNYLTVNSQYIDAYNASKQAVTDLYGATGNEQLQNVKAWYAVGIGNGLVLSTNETSTRLDNQFKIYPNPVKNGVFTIENDLNDATFEIYDASGKLIKQTEKLSKGTNKVNISGTQKGIYLVKVSSNGNTVAKKIVVE